ncbi:MAG: hypothetical protein GY874_09380 [Desulfobacteraceae bacterium]|nr:hypothetical protein [Desulfobacteraceae bacterium]
MLKKQNVDIISEINKYKNVNDSELINFKDIAKKELEIIKKHQEKIDIQFNHWDGSHINLKKYIKENMHDPDSFEYIETVYNDFDSYLIVKTTYFVLYE